LREKGQTLALAESCTGGLLSSLITDVPGSSDYFLASLVTYSNSSKMSLLGVRDATLKDHGAVSAPTAEEMAAGARAAGKADIGLSVTGIAGPGGGSKEKPVGLVFFALDLKGVRNVEQMIFSGDRIAIKKAAAEHALKMLIEHLER
jgi:PncC family amidohydrolase